MDKMKKLEEICRPVLTCFCNYWEYIEAGQSAEKDKFLRDIELHLEDAREKAARNPDIAGEYEKLEQSIVFFIDYMVKEGVFPFKDDWQLLARKYNELSGDEKFFDLLSEAQKDPESRCALPVYYLMLGLGFDGMYRGDPDYIAADMRRIAGELEEFLDIKTEPLAMPSLEQKALVKRHRGFLKGVCCAVAASFLFLILSLILNVVSFGKASGDYRKALSAAEESARLSPLSRKVAPPKEGP